jgi:lysophospholipase L1-like esterase
MLGRCFVFLGRALRRFQGGVGIAAVAGGLAAGAGQAQTQPTHVILGSSTAEGVGATNRDSSWVGKYTKALAARTKPWKVVNLAVGGYTTYHILPTGTQAPSGRAAPNPEHNITKALLSKPQGIIVNMGSNNDANSGYAAAETKANFDTLAAFATRNHVRIWFTTPQPRTQLINDPAKKAAQLEVKEWVGPHFGVQSIDFWTGIARPDAGIDPALDAGDGVHLNDKGHQILFAKAMAKDVPGVLEASVALAHPAGNGGAGMRRRTLVFTGFRTSSFPYDAQGRSIPALPR